MRGVLNYHPNFLITWCPTTTNINSSNDGLACTIVAAIQVRGRVATLIID